MILSHKILGDDHCTVIQIRDKTMEFDCSVKKYMDGLERYKAGALIHPFLSATEREFLMTGMTAEQQNSFYGHGDEE